MALILILIFTLQLATNYENVLLLYPCDPPYRMRLINPHALPLFYFTIVTAKSIFKIRK